MIKTRGSKNETLNVLPGSYGDAVENTIFASRPDRVVMQIFVSHAHARTFGRYSLVASSVVSTTAGHNSQTADDVISSAARAASVKVATILILYRINRRREGAADD